MKHRAIILCLLLACLVLTGCAAQLETALSQTPSPPAQALSSPAPALTRAPFHSTTQPGTLQTIYPYPAVQDIEQAYPPQPVEDMSYYYPPGIDFGITPNWATVTPEPTATPGPSPTITRTPAPTLTDLFQKPPPTLPAGDCSYYPESGEELAFASPDLDALTWEESEAYGFPVMRLSGFQLPLVEVIPAPDGSGLALSFASKLVNAPGGNETGLLVMEKAGAQPWLAFTSAYREYQVFQWISGSRLIWIDQGLLYSARADQGEKATYPLPEKALEVWANDRYAIVSGEKELWRVNLTTKQWSEINLHSLSYPMTNARLSPDRSLLLINDAGTLYQIPIGETGLWFQYQTIEYPGRGGRIGAPDMVGNDYIDPGVAEQSINQGWRKVLFEPGNKEPVPLNTIVNVGDFLAPLGVRPSPDHRWVEIAIHVSDADGTPYHFEKALSYLAPGNALNSGKLLPARYEVLAWRSQPAAAFVITDQDNVIQISLPSFQEKVLGRVRGWNSVLVLPGYTIIRGESSIALFDLNGNLLRMVDLPYQTDDIRLSAGVNNDLYLTAERRRQVNGQCTPYAWLEVINITLR